MQKKGTFAFIQCKRTPIIAFMQAPQAKKIAKELTIHGDTRIDPYFWLNQREDQAVLDYLNEENAYCKEILQPTEQL